ncbi:hypothetical protein TTY48_04190 [Tsukamurella sp. TY48]|nr:hypothetical protein TTY48_04190 [Tsukamurella sp. TY48]
MRPINMADFQTVGATPFDGWSRFQIRLFAQSLSGAGIAADKEAILAASLAQMDSIAELERDVASQTSKWLGDPAPRSFEVVGNYVTASYESAVSAAGVINQVNGLSDTATRTNEQFRDCSVRDTDSGGVGGELAAQLRSIYTSPVQADASTLPLGDEVKKPTFDGDTGTSGPQGPAPISAPGGSASGGTPASGPSSGGAGTDTAASTPSDPSADGVTADGVTADETNSAAGAPGAPSTSGTGQPPGTSPAWTPESAGSTDGIPAAGENGTVRTDRYDGGGSNLTPLFSPAASAAIGGGRSPGGGAGGLRAGGGPSPLGLRSEGSALRSATSTAAVSGPSASGARATSTPLGGTPGAAGGQRGAGDGRHRTPGYLVNRTNGEEIIGTNPLVGPGVIGEWRHETTADKPPRRDPRPN